MNSIKMISKRVFSYYERYPVLMNGFAGSSMFCLGEYIVQSTNSSYTKIDWSRIGSLGVLGAVQNGIVMTVLYGTFDRLIGRSAATTVVLTKLFFDQTLFAPQYDALFITVCNVYDHRNFESVKEELNRKFLTIWINDCAIWPFLNFYGFAWVSPKILPTYMAGMQLMWQIYLSTTCIPQSATHAQTESETKTDGKLLIAATAQSQNTRTITTLATSGIAVATPMLTTDTKAADSDVVLAVPITNSNTTDTPTITTPSSVAVSSSQWKKPEYSEADELEWHKERRQACVKLLTGGVAMAALAAVRILIFKI